MTATIQILLVLLAVLVAAALIARRLNTAPSIVLVIAGVALAIVPGLPRIELAPEFVLLVILPPLIYSAGVAMSWREFRFNLRPISLLAFGCVVFTTCAVAAAAHYVLNLPWAVGFLIGAIVAPPDVVAPLAIARPLGLPRRLLVVLEGEGLANDATALILYRFAVVAISTGAFSFGQAAGTFAAIVVGEIAWGIGIGWLSLHARRLARDPRVEIVLSLMAPYLAYWVPEHFGGSGVLATVATGLYVSWNGPLLISSATRLQGVFFWDLFIYVIEGFVFLITGLQARTLLDTATSFSLRELVVAVLVTTAIAIAARFVWVFPATYLPRWLSPSLRKRDPSPPWTWTFVIAFTGVRGVVSLAAALALPTTLPAGGPFPARDALIIVTLTVIVFTLLGQGLSLPWLIRRLHLAADPGLRAEEASARQRLLEAATGRIDQLYPVWPGHRPLLDQLRDTYRHRSEHIERQRDPSAADGGDRELIEHREIRRTVIDSEREALMRLRAEGEISDDVLRNLERELDLEERRMDA